MGWSRPGRKTLGFSVSLVCSIVYHLLSWFQDNKSAIALSVGGVSHKRSKHFGLEFDKFREYVEQREIEIFYKETNLLAADMLTKCLPPEKFKKHRDEIMGGETEQLYFLSVREKR